MRYNLLACAAATFTIITGARAELLTPIDQERYIEATSVWWDSGSGNNGSNTERVDAVAFEMFDEHLEVGGGGLAIADQLSMIGPDAITAEGFASGDGTGSVHYGGDGDGESSLSVTFTVGDWVYMDLTGLLSYDNEIGFSSVRLSLEHGGQPLIVEEHVGFEVEHEIFSIEEALWLEAGEYTIRASCSSGSAAAGGGGTSESHFEFEMILMRDEPCRADCYPTPGDGVVDVQDLLFVISEWGSTNSVADIAPGPGDGIVDVQDLLLVLRQWGPCAP